MKNNTTLQKGKKTNNDIKLYSLGGLGVVGMNMYIVECNDEIIIMDAGILFADDDVHGVSYIIPDFTYLKQNQKKIVGLFITHGHEDHIGAIPFLLKQVEIPTIYASGIAIGIIKNKMLEFSSINYNLKEYTESSIYKYKHFEISFFRTNHSIPDSFGIAIKTRLGYIVNTGDFKFDFMPIGEKSNYYKMSSLGKEGVLCLMADSTNANISQFSSSEKKVGITLMNLFSQIEGRIIVAAFASNVYRVQQIIEASIASGRKVVVFGHSMEKTIEIASKLKYITYPKGWVLNSRELKKQNTDFITILCTGSQGEPMAALSRIANGTHKQIKLLPNDTVIYSSKAIPGNELFINRNINKLVHAGAHVIQNSPLTDTHTTGHASQNEIRMMLSFMQPKYFMPVHGEYLMLKEHAKIASETGVKKENCFVLDTGDVLTFNDKGAKVFKKKIPASEVYIDASLSDVDSNILKERKHMADEGLLTITFTITKNKRLIGNVVVKSSGFADFESSKSLENSIRQKTLDLFTNSLKEHKNINIRVLEKQVITGLSQFIYQTIERRPLIVPVINVINN